MSEARSLRLRPTKAKSNQPAGRSRRLTATIYNEDCFQAFAKLPSDSVDAVITDPPYFLPLRQQAGDLAGQVVGVQAALDVVRQHFRYALSSPTAAGMSATSAHQGTVIGVNREDVS